MPSSAAGPGETPPEVSHAGRNEAPSRQNEYSPLPSPALLDQYDTLYNSRNDLVGFKPTPKLAAFELLALSVIVFVWFRRKKSNTTQG